MPANTIIINGSPKKDGNTACLINWFRQGAEKKGGSVDVVNTAYLKYKVPGCLSCRACQSREEYGCVIDDEASAVLKKMTGYDVIVMASPLYFFSASAQLKVIFDRMFSLYKWDNAAGTMITPLKGKTFVLLGSAYEDVGLDAMEKPFSLTAEYTGMRFRSLVVPNAGVSGDIKKIPDIQEKVLAFGSEV